VPTRGVSGPDKKKSKGVASAKEKGRDLKSGVKVDTKKGKRKKKIGGPRADTWKDGVLREGPVGPTGCGKLKKEKGRSRTSPKNSEKIRGKVIGGKGVSKERGAQKLKPFMSKRNPPTQGGSKEGLKRQRLHGTKFRKGTYSNFRGELESVQKSSPNGGGALKSTKESRAKTW